MSRLLMIGCLVGGCLALTMGHAQNALAQVGSSDPTNDSTPRFQTRAEIAALPPSSNRGTVRAGFTPNAIPVGDQVGSYGARLSTASAPNDTYPYPATSRRSRLAFQSNYVQPNYVQPNYVLPRVNPGSVTPQNPPAIQNTSPLSIGTNSTIKSLRDTAGRSNFALPASYSGQAPGLVTTGYRQSFYQAPTLGLGRTSVHAAQTCYCQPIANPAAVATRTSVGYQAAAPNSAIGSGLGVPPLDIQVPGQQSGPSVSSTNYPYPLPTAPQSSSQGGSWWTPFVTGSGNYPAVIRRQNMPVGSYLGQGVVGQPTAYVDGQPVRNLLRYIMP